MYLVSRNKNSIKQWHQIIEEITTDIWGEAGERRTGLEYQTQMCFYSTPSFLSDLIKLEL